MTFLIDASGSMNQPDRLGLVQKSIGMLLNELDPDDTIAIVKYDSKARLILGHTKAKNKKEIMKVVE